MKRGNPLVHPCLVVSVVLIHPTPRKPPARRVQSGQLWRDTAETEQAQIGGKNTQQRMCDCSRHHTSRGDSTGIGDFNGHVQTHGKTCLLSPCAHFQEQIAQPAMCRISAESRMPEQ